ncbi:hypothetical protein CL658_04570 [bacterium]|nr:hypothetical protein [bacterium]
MKALIFFLIILLELGYLVIAHPVTYKGGFATSALQTRNDTTLYLNYSISQKKSYGVQFVSLSDTNERLLFLTGNRLLKRYYFFDAQANLYATTSLGFNHDNTQLFPCLHLKADAENRRYYTDFSATIMKPSSALFTKLTSRLGWAPYKHHFSTLSTWFMIEAVYLNYHNSQLELMPIYRGFYKSLLWELGYNGSNTFIHVMLHF